MLLLERVYCCISGVVGSVMYAIPRAGEESPTILCTVISARKSAANRLCWLARAVWQHRPLSPRAIIAGYTSPCPRPRTTHAEIEVKLPVTDLPALLRACKALGAVTRPRP